jgi:hypothetical protein
VRTRTTLTATALVVAGALLGWLAASGRLATALGQDKTRASPTPTAGIPSVLPRPDFHFPGNVGRTNLDLEGRSARANSRTPASSEATGPRHGGLVFYNERNTDPSPDLL